MLNKTNTLEESTKKPWVDVINSNRIPANEMAIKFISPKIMEGVIEVEIKEANIESEVKLWESAIIMYALGRDLSMNAVK